MSCHHLLNNYQVLQLSILPLPKDIAKNYDYILRLCKKIDNKDIIQKWVNKTFPKNTVETFIELFNLFSHKCYISY